jgi:hypothetical protein
MGIRLLKVTPVRSRRPRSEGLGTVVLIESRRSEASEGTAIVFEAGMSAVGEFRCLRCGYGVVVRSVLPECPMCRGLTWKSPDGSSIGVSSVI